MTSETNSHENQPHWLAATPLKPKRRCKIDAPVEAETQKFVQASHSPVLLNARLEFARHGYRLTRSGRPQMQFRRVTSPSEFMELMPKNSRQPVLAKVVDKIKTYRPRSGTHQGIWALLRYWMFAFR